MTEDIRDEATDPSHKNPEDQVILREIQPDIPEDRIENLKRSINPMSESADGGVDIFQRSLNFIRGY